MGFNVEKIFADVAFMSKVKTKKDYEAHMEEFKSQRYELLNDMIKAEDVKAAASVFCGDVTGAFKKFGKVRGGDLMNLNYFMIYYIFPSILMNEENGTEICDNIRDAWNEHFNANINYADYDSLMEGFRTKIFGIPIGKN